MIVTALLPVVAGCFYLATLVVFLEALARNHLLSVAMDLSPVSDSSLVASATATNISVNVSSSGSNKTLLAVRLHSEVQMVPAGVHIAIIIILVAGILVSIANFVDLVPLLFFRGSSSDSDRASAAVLTRRSHWKGASKTAQVLSNILVSGLTTCLALLSVSTMISWATVDETNSTGGFASSPAMTQSVVAFWVLALLLCPLQLVVHYAVAPATQRTTRLRLLMLSPPRRRQALAIGARSADGADAGQATTATTAEDRSSGIDEMRDASPSQPAHRLREHEQSVDDETASDERAAIADMFQLFTGGAAYEKRLFSINKWLAFSIGLICAAFNLIALVTLAVAFDQGLFSSPLVDGAVAVGANFTIASASSSQLIVKRLSTGIVATFCIVCGVGCIAGFFNALEWVILDTASEYLDAQQERQRQRRRPGRRHESGAAQKRHGVEDGGSSSSSEDEFGAPKYDADGRRVRYLCGFLRRPFDCHVHVILPLFCISTPLRKRVQLYMNRFASAAHLMSGCVVAVTLVSSVVAKSRSAPPTFENPDVVVAFWVFLGLASLAQWWSWALVPGFLLSRLLVELRNHEAECREEAEQVARHRLLMQPGADFGPVLLAAAAAAAASSGVDEPKPKSGAGAPVQFDPRDGHHLLCDIPAGGTFLDPWRPRNHVVPPPSAGFGDEFDDEEEQDEDRSNDAADIAAPRQQQRREAQSQKSKHAMRPEELAALERRRLQRVNAAVSRAVADLRHIDPAQARHWALLSMRAQRWRDSSQFLFWQRYEQVLARIVSASASAAAARRHSNSKPAPAARPSEPIAADAAAKPSDGSKQRPRHQHRHHLHRKLARVRLLGDWHAFRVMNSVPTNALDCTDADSGEDDAVGAVAASNQAAAAVERRKEDDEEQQRALLFPPCKRLVGAISLLAANRDTSALLFQRFGDGANVDGEDDNIAAAALSSSSSSSNNSALHLARGLFHAQLCIGGVWRRTYVDSLVPVQPPQHIAELGHEPAGDDADCTASFCAPCCSDDASSEKNNKKEKNKGPNSAARDALRRLLAPHCARELQDVFPALLHKATAKLLGSYAAISTELGDALSEIHDLSGAPIERFSAWTSQNGSSRRSGGNTRRPSETFSHDAAAGAFIEMDAALLRFDGRIEETTLYPLVVLTSRRFPLSGPAASASASATSRSIDQLSAPRSQGGRGVCGGVPCRVVATVTCPRDAVKAAALVDEVKRFQRKRVNLAAWSRSRDGLDSDIDEDLLDIFTDDCGSPAMQSRRRSAAAAPPAAANAAVDVDALEVNSESGNADDDIDLAQISVLPRDETASAAPSDEDLLLHPHRFVLLDDDSLMEDPEAEFAALRRVIDRSLFPDSHLRRLIRAARKCHDRAGAFAAAQRGRGGDDSDSDNDGDHDDDGSQQRPPGGFDDSGVDPLSTIVPLARPLPLVGFGAFNDVVLGSEAERAAAATAAAIERRQQNRRQQQQQQGEAAPAARSASEASFGAQSSSSATGIFAAMGNAAAAVAGNVSAAFLCRDAIATYLMRSGLCVADDLSVCTFADARMIARLVFVEWNEAASRVFASAGVAHVPVTGFLDDVARVHVALGAENGMVEHAAREAVRYARMRFVMRRWAAERLKHKRRKIALLNAQERLNQQQQQQPVGSAASAGGSRPTSPNSVSFVASSGGDADDQQSRPQRRRSSRSPSPVAPPGSMPPQSVGAAASSPDADASMSASFSLSAADFGSLSMSMAMSASAVFNQVASASALFFERNPHLERRFVDMEQATFVGVASRTPAFAAQALPLYSPLTDIRLPNRFSAGRAVSDWVIHVNVVCPPRAAAYDDFAQSSASAFAASASAAAGGEGPRRAESPARKHHRTTTTVFIGLHQPDARNAVAAFLTEGDAAAARRPCAPSVPRGRRQQQQQHREQHATLPACGCTYHPLMISVIRVPKKGNDNGDATLPPQQAELVVNVAAHKQSNSDSFASERDVYLRVELEGAPGEGEDYLIVPRMQTLHQHLFYLAAEEPRQQQQQQQQQARVQSPTSRARSPSPSAPLRKAPAAQTKGQNPQQQQHTVRNRDGSTYTISLDPEVTVIRSGAAADAGGDDNDDDHGVVVVERKSYQVWQSVPSKKQCSSSSAPLMSLVPRRQVLLDCTAKSAPFVLSLLVPKSCPLVLTGIRPNDDENDDDDDGDAATGAESTCIKARLIRPSARFAAEVAAHCESPLEQLAFRLKRLPTPRLLAEMLEEARRSVLAVSATAVWETLSESATSSSSTPFSMEQYLAQQRNHFFVRQISQDVPHSISHGRVPLAQIDSEALF